MSLIDFNAIKNEVELTRCSVHNKNVAITVKNTSFHIENCCCKAFEVEVNNLLEKVSERKINESLNKQFNATFGK